MTTSRILPTNPYPSAGIFKRIMALVYDLLVLMAVLMLYGWIVIYLIQTVLLGTPLEDGELAKMSLPGQIGLWFLPALFYCFFWRRGGQTLGMKAWRLQLLNTDNNPPTLKQCLVRCLIAPICILLGGVGYLWCLFDKHGHALHDLLSHTQVVQLPK